MITYASRALLPVPLLASLLTSCGTVEEPSDALPPPALPPAAAPAPTPASPTTFRPGPMFLVRNGRTAQVVAAHPETNDVSPFGEPFEVASASEIKLWHDPTQARVIVYERWWAPPVARTVVRAGDGGSWRTLARDVYPYLNGAPRDLSFLTVDDASSTRFLSFDGGAVHTFAPRIYPFRWMADDGRTLLFEKKEYETWLWTSEGGERRIDGFCRPSKIFATSVVASCYEGWPEARLEWRDRTTDAQLAVPAWADAETMASAIHDAVVVNGDIVKFGDRGGLVRLGRIAEGLSREDLVRVDLEHHLVFTRDARVFDTEAKLLGRLPAPDDAWSFHLAARRGDVVVAMVGRDTGRSIEAWRTDRDARTPITVWPFQLTDDGRFIVFVDHANKRLMFEDLDTGAIGPLVGGGAENVLERYNAGSP